MEAGKFEGLVKTALDKFEGQGTEIATMKSTFEQAVAKLSGQVETLTALNPAKAAFVQRSRGIEVPWENKEAAIEFTRFMRAASRRDEAVLKQMNENNAGDGGGGNEADGGYLVPVEFRPTLLRIIEQWGVARQEFQIVPMTRDEMQYPVYNGEWTDGSQPAGPTYWVNENAQITSSWAQFANVTLTCRKLAAMIPTSNELLQDAALPVATLIATLVGEFLAKEEDRVGFVGTGGTDPSLMTGALPAAGKTVTIAGTNINTITAEDLLQMTLELNRASLEGAKFYMHRSIFAFIRQLKTTDGMPIYNPPAVSGPSTLWGYPVQLVESLPNFTGNVADKRYVLFGNLKNMYMGDRMGLSVASTDIVGFQNFQTHFRFVERIGYKLTLPDTLCALKTHA